MSDQVEAAARAIHADDPPVPWEDLKPWEVSEYRRKARVVIGAYEEARKSADLDEWHDAYTKGFVSGLDAEKKRAAGEARKQATEGEAA